MTTLKPLDFQEALHLTDTGAAFVDLRPIHEYLDVHIPGSIPLLYEQGPGMAARARDCLPLDLPLIVSEPQGMSAPAVINAAASLRGKGFTVVGKVVDALNAWARARSTPTSTDVAESADPPAGPLLDVGDPGAALVGGAIHVPVEKLWGRVYEIPLASKVTIVAGFGVRAALAIGILERHGFSDVALWRKRG